MTDTDENDYIEYPWDRLHHLAALKLCEHFPNLHNEILWGMHWNTVDTLAGEVLIIHKVGGFYLRWKSAEEQNEAFGGIEELLFEDLSPELIAFYGEKLKKFSPRFGYYQEVAESGSLHRLTSEKRR